MDMKEAMGQMVVVEMAEAITQARHMVEVGMPIKGPDPHQTTPPVLK